MIRSRGTILSNFLRMPGCSSFGFRPPNIGEAKGLEEGVDLIVVQKHYKGLVKSGQHKEAGALMTVCTRAHACCEGAKAS